MQVAPRAAPRTLVAANFGSIAGMNSIEGALAKSPVHGASPIYLQFMIEAMDWVVTRQPGSLRKSRVDDSTWVRRI